MYDTHKFATVSGDRQFLTFLYERLNKVHKEDRLLDYMHTLDDFRNGINKVVEKAEKYDKLMSALQIIIKGSLL